MMDAIIPLLRLRDSNKTPLFYFFFGPAWLSGWCWDGAECLHETTLVVGDGLGWHWDDKKPAWDASGCQWQSHVMAEHLYIQSIASPTQLLREARSYTIYGMILG